MDQEVEYVATVRVERVSRYVKPAGTPIASSSRRTTGEERIVRDKAEVVAFTVRGVTVSDIRQRVKGVLNAALAGDVKGDPETEEEDEEF